MGKVQEVRKFSEAVKIKIVEEIESGKYSQAEAARAYGAKRTSIWDWLGIYGKLRNQRNIVEVVMADQKDKIEELQGALGEAQLKVRIYESIIECAGRYYKADLKKNFGTKASELLRKGPKPVLK